MAPRYKTWLAVVQPEPRVVGATRNGSVVEDVPVVTISDPKMTFTVTLDAHGEINSLAIADGGRVTSKTLREIPLGYLRDVARAEIARFNADPPENGLQVRGGDEDPLTVGDPTPAEFAAVWNATPAKTKDEHGVLYVPRREALAARWGVPVWRIDEWTREARKQGLIGKPTTGRPSKKKESEK